MVNAKVGDLVRFRLHEDHEHVQDKVLIATVVRFQPPDCRLFALATDRVYVQVHGMWFPHEGKLTSWIWVSKYALFPARPGDEVARERNRDNVLEGHPA